MERIKYHLKKLSYKMLLIYECILTKYFFKIDNSEIKQIIKVNRDFLKNTQTFLEVDQFEKNNYGMDLKIFNNLDKEIKEYPTYTDIIIFISNYLSPAKICYLEIGLSVMKNFIQIENYLKDAKLVGFDINPIVPKYKESFSLLESNNNSSSIFVSKENYSSYYFQGSVLDKDHIKEFNSFFTEKFNLVFSDALHTPQGIRSEFDNIISKNLDNNFILYFDDLDFPGLFDTVNEIYNELLESDRKVYFNIFKVYGWVGQYEKMHKNGIISSINFHEELKKHKINLPFMKLIKSKK